MTGRIPKGEAFFPNVEMSELEELHSKERDPKAKDRLLAFMARKRGESLGTIGKSLNRPSNTIHYWLRRAKDGLDRLHDQKRPGRPRRLTAAQLAGLRDDLIAGPQAHGFESHLWMGRTVAEHVRNKYGVRFTARTAQKLLLEMDFRHVKTRPRHPKAASEEEKRAFKKS